MALNVLVKRNIVMFFKDKGLVLTSLISPMILILLYATFLRNVYVDSFQSAVKSAGITIDMKYIDGFVYGWLFSSLVAVSSVTVAFCSNMLSVQDKVNRTNYDLLICPVSKPKLWVSYYLSSFIVTYLIIIFEIIVGFIIMGFTGWFLSFKDVIGILVSAFLLVNFGTALSSIINVFLTTQGQMSAVGSVISSVYGFICGAYMPISQFGNVLKNVLSFLPGTYGTCLVRHHYERGVLEALKTEVNFPEQVVSDISKNFDISMKFFDKDVSVFVLYLIMSLSVLILMGVYLYINKKYKDDLTK